MGKMASQMFGDLGTAGGHRSMARAEIPLSKLERTHPQQFIWQRLGDYRKKKMGKTGNGKLEQK
jgi:nanoRNase/pAp phosphatase (c-di-AMP/oligoRNAs hydrolase)